MDSDLAKESASPSEASVGVHVEGVHPDGTADAGDGAPNVRASAGSRDVGSDKRDRRIAHAHIYTEGVVAWRAAQPLVVNDQAQAQADPVSPHARVYVRVRPLFEHESERGEWSAVSVVGGITLHEGIERVQSGKGMVKALKHHTFVSARPLADNDAVKEMSLGLVSEAVAGGVATLFMLGMTGSGKTYNMDVVHGAAPAALFAALAAPSANGQAQPTAGLIAYELVGKKSFDLLSPEKGEVMLRTGADGKMRVSGTEERVTSDPAQLEEWLRSASARRETGATGANATSSRSHAVYQISTPGGGRLLLVDLAGNEGSIETLYHTKEQMAESAEINASLMALKNCLHARATSAPHIPFRDSTLTRVLQDALTDPKAATAVLACLSPACTHLELSLRTMAVSVKLMGREEAATVGMADLRDVGVKRGGPSKWDGATLAAWVSEQPFAENVLLPHGATGASLMKLTAVRLAPFCGGSAEAAQALFAGLRLAAKEAAAAELQARKEIVAAGSKGSVRGFARK